MENAIKIEQTHNLLNLKNIKIPFYSLILIDGDASFYIDDVLYSCKAKSIIFLTPYQNFCFHEIDFDSLYHLQFHGDFYCIEYHKKEVACNGILFNNIYSDPYISLTDELFNEIFQLFQKIENFDSLHESYNISLVKSYLQLILALSSKEKQVSQTEQQAILDCKDSLATFKEVLEKHFIKEKSVAFYADYYALSVDTFSKKVKKLFGKSPSVLIQERMVLEAKKQLHLTYKNIKEIAAELGFEDEFYFSRYFKKQVGVSPKLFREQVGISIVAK